MKYLLTRLSILFVIAVVCLFCINTAIRQTLINACYHKTGMVLKVGRVKTSWDPAIVQLHDLEMTAPENGRDTLGTIKSLIVQLDRGELFRKRFHANDTRIHGVKLNILPENNLGESLAQTWDQVNDRFSDGVSDWNSLPIKGFLSGNLDEAAREYARQFEIAKATADIEKRWSTETGNLKQQADVLKGVLNRIKQTVDTSKQNQDQLQAIIVILQELERFDRELTGFQQYAQKLEPQLLSDRQRLEDAIRADTRTIEAMQGQITIPKIDSDLLSQYFLASDTQEKLGGLLCWLDWGREYLPEQDEKWLENLRFFSIQRQSGTNVVFPGMEDKTEVHFHDVGLDGQLDFMQKPIFFAGGIRNFSNQPKRLDQPVVLRFCLSGRELREGLVDETLKILADTNAEKLIDREKEGMQTVMNPVASNSSPVSPQSTDFFHALQNMKNVSQMVADIEIPTIYISAVLDRTSEMAKDHFFVYCPDYRLPERILGNPSELALALSPGVSRFYAELVLQGDQVDGRLSLIQNSVRIHPLLPQELRGHPIERVLTSTANGLTDVVVTANLTGTRQQLNTTLTSNLGDELISRITPVLQQEWGLVHQKAITLLNQESQKTFGNIDQYFSQQFQPILDDIASNRNLLDQSVRQSGVPLDQLINSQISRLSEKDQQLARTIAQNPNFSSLFSGNQGQTGASQNNIESKINQKVDQLLDKNFDSNTRDSIRGILGGLGNSLQQSPPPQPQPVPVYP